MKTFFVFAIIALAIAIIRGFEKGKKSGYTVFGFLGVIIAIFTFKAFGDIAHALSIQGMGKPEVLGQNLGLLFAIAFSTSIAVGIYSLIFMIVKFNKKDLIPEICSVVMCGIIALSSFQLVGTLGSLEEKYTLPAVSTDSVKMMIPFNK